MRKLVVKHIPTFAKPYQVERQYIDSSGFCYKIDKFTNLNFVTEQEALDALKEMEQSNA